MWWLAVQVPTFEEYLEAAQRGGTKAKPVGVYPETKHPQWHDSLDIMKGTSLSDLVLETLTKYGYKGDINSRSWARQPVFIQSFEVRCGHVYLLGAALRRLPTCYGTYMLVGWHMLALALGQSSGASSSAHPAGHDTRISPYFVHAPTHRKTDGGKASSAVVDAAARVQVGNLKALAGKTDLPLVQLLGGWEGYVTPDTGATHAEMTTPAALREIASYAAGIGPWKHTIVTIDEEANHLLEKTDLVQKIHAAGMQVRRQPLLNIPHCAKHTS